MTKTQLDLATAAIKAAYELQTKRMLEHRCMACGSSAGRLGPFQRYLCLACAKEAAEARAGK